MHALRVLQSKTALNIISVIECSSSYLVMLFVFKQNVYTVAWTRKDGRPLDTRAVDDGQGTLTIRSVRREDVGAYLCTGSDFYNVATDEAYLTIRGRLSDDPYYLIFFLVLLKL